MTILEETTTAPNRGIKMTSAPETDLQEGDHPAVLACLDPHLLKLTELTDRMFFYLLWAGERLCENAKANVRCKKPE